MGGDEFAILVADITADNINVPLAHFAGHLSRYNAQRSHSYKLSVSVGAICVGFDGAIWATCAVPGPAKMTGEATLRVAIAEPMPTVVARRAFPKR